MKTSFKKFPLIRFLRPFKRKQAFKPPPSSLELEKIRNLIYETLSFVPINVDEVIRECQLQASDVWIVLLEMEIAGRLERHLGGKVSLKEEWKSE